MSKLLNKRGLGRGLEALLADQPKASGHEAATKVALSKIRPNRYQPRTSFNSDELDSLTESIRKEGVLMPILLRPDGDQYELIAGERRWRASQAAGLLDIPAVVRDVSDLQALELAIIENEQRDDLTAVESARAYKKLIEEFAYTQKQVAESIGVSRVQVSNLIRLLQLSGVIQSMIESRELSMGQARPLVGLESAVAEQLARTCVEQGWSARQMEKEVKHLIKASVVKDPAHQVQDAETVALQEELSRSLGLTVVLKHQKNGSGELKISFSDAKELEVALSRLRKV
ncbi:MAG: ParB/RepB/Spo0J family partition protein [Mariprofundaceae bacterium]